MVFAVVALIKVYTGSARQHRVHPEASWFNPFAIQGGIGALQRRAAAGDLPLLGLGLRRVSVNEETENPARARQRGGRLDVVLIGIYVLVTVAAMAYGGLSNLLHNPTTSSPPLATASSAALLQDPDVRDPELGIGLDPDDDPADRAYDALDGPCRRDPQAVR